MALILCIDSDESRQARLISSLAKAGFETLKANCVLSAVEILESKKPDLMICSEKLSHIHAIDLLELRLESDVMKDIPVIITGLSKRYVSTLFDLGCDDFLLFPYDHEELIFRIRSVLKRSRSQGVSGDFSHLSMLELIQMLVTARRSGLLEVDTKKASGFLAFLEGQVFHASAEGQDGEDAFLMLLKQGRSGGRFTFVGGEVDELDTNIEKRTDHLLLSLASQIDEDD